MSRSLLFILLVGSAVNTFAALETTTQRDNQLSEFENHKVVPDVVDVAPLNVASVTYKSGVSAEFGNVLTPTQVQDVPNVTYEADSSKFYTLLMTDPDVTATNPMQREFRHWFVGNIPGNSVDEGDTLSGYIGSGPRPGSGLHRYVFLVFEQPEKLNFTEPRSSSISFAHRTLFSTRNFAKKYNLGNAVAGNLYQAEWDEYVPILYAKLSAGK